MWPHIRSIKCSFVDRSEPKQFDYFHLSELYALSSCSAAVVGGEANESRTWGWPGTSLRCALALPSIEVKITNMHLIHLAPRLSTNAVKAGNIGLTTFLHAFCSLSIRFNSIGQQIFPHLGRHQCRRVYVSHLGALNTFPSCGWATVCGCCNGPLLPFLH